MIKQILTTNGEGKSGLYQPKEPKRFCTILRQYCPSDEKCHICDIDIKLALLSYSFRKK